MYQTSAPSRQKGSPDHIWCKAPHEFHEPACCAGFLELLLDPPGSDPRTVVERVPGHDARFSVLVSKEANILAKLVHRDPTDNACNERVEAKGCKEVANALHSGFRDEERHRRCWDRSCFPETGKIRGKGIGSTFARNGEDNKVIATMERRAGDRFIGVELAEELCDFRFVFKSAESVANG